jgi:acetoacetate decarboxylase
LTVEKDTLVGTLDYGPVRVATGTMGFKHRAVSSKDVLNSLAKPNYLLKIIPHVDGASRICEIVSYDLEHVELKGAWSGPAALDLHAHALAPVAGLPVLEVVSAVHLTTDLTLGLGKVVHDYLAK